jgi:hypothetical protein
MCIRRLGDYDWYFTYKGINNYIYFLYININYNLLDKCIDDEYNLYTYRCPNNNLCVKNANYCPITDIKI